MQLKNQLRQPSLIRKNTKSQLPQEQEELVDEYTEDLEKDDDNNPLEYAVERAEKMWQKHNDECAESSLTNPIKALVSKNKKRFEWDGYDLDLAYITDHIIAMGFPSESLESIYRNSMQEVEKFLNEKHRNHYRVYNLCSQKKYPADRFGGRFEEFPFNDHMAPPFELIYQFCKAVKKYLGEHKKNVAVVHCKAGKGRTGVMTSCYMIYSGIIDNAFDALQYYGVMRTVDHKVQSYHQNHQSKTKGVTIPSQIRYVKYFEQALKRGMTLESYLASPKRIKIHTLIINTVPNLGIFGGCTPWIHIQCGEREYKSKYSHELEAYKEEDTIIKINVGGWEVAGDFIVTFYHKGLLNKSEKFMHLCLNTCFMENTNVYPSREIDGPKKSDNRFSKDMSVRIECTKN